MQKLNARSKTIINPQDVMFMNFLKYSLLVPLLVWANFAHSQVINADTCDQTLRFPITQYSSILRTTTPVPIDSVITLQSQFTASGKETVMVLNYEPYYYWFRFVVNNRQDFDRQLMLLMAPVGMHDGRLYQKKESKWTQVANSGTKYKFSDRSYQFTHYVFPFDLQKNATDTLYLSIDASNVYKAFGFAMIKPQELKLFENKMYFIFGIIGGLLLLFLLLNVSLFFVSKEKLHLWYALYIFFLFLIVIKNDQLDQEFFGLDSELAFRLTPYGSIGCFAIAILMHVVQKFLYPVLVHQKKLNQYTSLIKYNLICSGLVHAFVFSTNLDHRVQFFIFTWCKTSMLIGGCMILIDCLYCAKKGFRRSLFIFFGSLVFMIGSIQRLYFPSTLSFLFPPTTFHIGIILEVFIISVGLIYSYWMEKEFHRQKEDQIRLQVTRDISDEIHDNVGQMLALANLYLKTLYSNASYETQKVKDAQSLISRAIFELRDLSRSLKNDILSKQTISQEIEMECKRLEKSGIFQVGYAISGKAVDLDHNKQSMIVRITKEAIQNIIKHSQADKVNILLCFKRNFIFLKIEDNGIGFDQEEADINGNGLKNIRNRCALLNGSCKFKTMPGHGTHISISIPIILPKIITKNTATTTSWHQLNLQ